MLPVSAALLLSSAWLQLCWKWISSVLHGCKVLFQGTAEYPIDEPRGETWEQLGEVVLLREQGIGTPIPHRSHQASPHRMRLLQIDDGLF